jgi:GcrA cell cycle regulator
MIMGSTNSAWTPERLDLAKTLWVAGNSAAQIAKELGGVSRSAVLGKLYRADLMGQGAPSRPGHTGEQRAKRSTRSTAPTPRAQAKVFGATRVKMARPVLLMGNGAVLERVEAQAPRAAIREAAFQPLLGTTPLPYTERAFNQCSWPVGGEGADTLCCGAPIAERSWCKAHLTMGTQPIKAHQTVKAYIRRFAA